jgi:hypothetical protein
LLLRRVRLRSRTAWVLASPSPPLGRIENTVVVGVHPIELRSRSLCGSFLGAMDVLLASEAAGARGRWADCGRAWLSCGLLARSLRTRLGEGNCRQQG